MTSVPREIRLSGYVGLELPDLAIGDGVVVVDELDEVEARSALGNRRKRVVERLAHQRVARLVLAVDVEVARRTSRAPTRTADSSYAAGE